jgi:hypothetical protein
VGSDEGARGFDANARHVEISVCMSLVKKKIVNHIAANKLQLKQIMK